MSFGILSFSIAVTCTVLQKVYIFATWASSCVNGLRHWTRVLPSRNPTTCCFGGNFGGKFNSAGWHKYLPYFNLPWVHASHTEGETTGNWERFVRWEMLPSTQDIRPQWAKFIGDKKSFSEWTVIILNQIKQHASFNNAENCRLIIYSPALLKWLVKFTANKLPIQIESKDLQGRK